MSLGKQLETTGKQLKTTIKHLSRHWPFQTPALGLSSTAPRGCGPLLDMQPWPKPFNHRTTWHPSKSIRIRGKNFRVTTCER